MSHGTLCSFKNVQLKIPEVKLLLMVHSQKRLTAVEFKELCKSFEFNTTERIAWIWSQGWLLPIRTHLPPYHYWNCPLSLFRGWGVSVEGWNTGISIIWPFEVVWKKILVVAFECWHLSLWSSVPLVPVVTCIHCSSVSL